MRLSFKGPGNIFRQTMGKTLAAAAILIAGATLGDAPNAQVWGGGANSPPARDCSRLKGLAHTECQLQNTADRERHKLQNRPPPPKKGKPKAASTAGKCPSFSTRPPSKLACKISNNSALGCRPGKPKGWKKLSGDAVDIGAGPVGNMWAISKSGEAKRFLAGKWKGRKIKGTRIDAGRQGLACMVGPNSEPHCFVTRGKRQLPGKVTDIGVGPKGQIWALDAKRANCNYGVQKWTGKKWEKISGGAVRIDVDPKGMPWVINSNNNIFRYDGAKWHQLIGSAWDIGIGAKGEVWVVGSDYAPYKYDGKYWVKTPGQLSSISVQSNGKPVGTDFQGNVYAQ